jgi:hypothetical protein
MALVGKEYLRVGDHVIFRSSAFENYLCAEGIISESLYLNKEIDYIDEFVFCVHLQRRYSAYKEYAEYMHHVQASGAAQTPLEDTVQRSLKYGKENEIKLNDIYQSGRLREELKFGATIQLFHVKSQKYLTVIPEKLAENERANLRVALDANGSEFSWIQLMPRYKIDREGDGIVSGVEMYLKFVERTNEFLHCADNNVLEGKVREINCSLEPSAWKLQIFLSSIDLQDYENPKKRHVLSSQLVYLHDPERQCSLAIMEAERNLLIASERMLIGSKSSKSPPRRGSSKSSTSDVILFESNMDSDTVSSRALWIVENIERVEGGPLSWRNEQVRFKHLNTGMYLCLKEKKVQSPMPQMTPPEDNYSLSVTKDMLEPTSYFSLEDLEHSSVHVRYKKPVRISSLKVYIRRGDATSSNDYLPKLTESMEKAVAFEICEYVADERASREAALAGSQEQQYHLHAPEIPDAPTTKQAIDVYASISARKYLRKYIRNVQIPINQTAPVINIWPKLDRTEMSFFYTFMDKMTLFVQGLHYSSVPAAMDGAHNSDAADAGVIAWRQYLIRDQHVLKDVLSLISKLAPLSTHSSQSPRSESRGRGGAQASRRSPRGTIGSLSDVRRTGMMTADEDQLNRMCQIALHKCLVFLYWAIKGNHKNQCYVAPDMKVLFCHLETQSQAGLCVEELLKNSDIQQQSIGQRDIGVFVEMLRTSRLNMLYLRLLNACCSCEGRGMNLNQCYIAQRVFADSVTDLTIRMDLTKDKDSDAPIWSDINSLYIPTGVTQQCMKESLLGYPLLSASMPTFSLSWTTSSIDLSALALFGTMKVNLLEFFRHDGDDLKLLRAMFAKDTTAKASGKHLPEIKKRQAVVLKYFVTQIYLAAETCMDRNYVAMKYMHEKYPYEVLIALLKLNLSETLNAAVMRLLLNLHIDCNPQVEIIIPRLSRPLEDIAKETLGSRSSSVSGSGSVPLPTVEASEVYKFGLIQQMISEHVHKMANCKWGSFSLSVLQVLKKLVYFNFYGTRERLVDVTRPLVQTLDRREVHNELSRKPFAYLLQPKSSLNDSFQAAKTSMMKTSTRLGQLRNIKIAPELTKMNSYSVLKPPAVERMSNRVASGARQNGNGNDSELRKYI